MTTAELKEIVRQLRVLSDLVKITIAECDVVSRLSRFQFRFTALRRSARSQTPAHNPVAAGRASDLSQPAFCLPRNRLRQLQLRSVRMGPSSLTPWQGPGKEDT